MPAGTTSVPSRRPPRRSGSSSLRRMIRRLTELQRAAEGSSRAVQIRSAATGSAASRLGPPSSVRASSAIRSASRRRASASCARLRASSASVLAIAAVTKNAASATQLRESAMVNRPVGGMWKKLKAAALTSAVNSPQRRPQKIETPITASR